MEKKFEKWKQQSRLRAQSLRESTYTLRSLVETVDKYLDNIIELEMELSQLEVDIRA